MIAEDRDRLIRIEEQVLGVREDLRRGERRMENHAKRLRVLELWRSWMTGALALLTALLAFAMKVVRV